MQRRSGIALTLGAALLIGLQTSHRPQPPVTYISAFALTGDDPWFGGLSAVELSADGLRATAVSDRSRLVELTLTRDGTGRIDSVTSGPMDRMLNDKGKVLRGISGDSEGLDVTADGTLIVSFEGEPTRVMQRRKGETAFSDLPIAREFASLHQNGGLEAVAADAAGRIFALAEGSSNETGPIPVFRLNGDTWDTQLSIPRRGILLPVAADFGPDGRFYVLERGFDLFGGFSSRVRRFDVGEDGLSNETTVIETAPGVHDNLEGLSVWRDASGSLRATMIEDDNFQALLRNELVEYHLPD